MVDYVIANGILIVYHLGSLISGVNIATRETTVYSPSILRKIKMVFKRKIEKFLICHFVGFAAKHESAEFSIARVGCSSHHSIFDAGRICRRSVHVHQTQICGHWPFTAV